MTTDPRYPIGRFDRLLPANADQRAVLIRQIAEAPDTLRAAIAGLDEAQQETPYREGGWTVRQVVHHLPDSHMNAYTRIKLALTEDVPMIKTYEEDRWADLFDARTAPVETSLRLLEALHERWVILLKSMKPEDFQRKLRHPESGENIVDFFVALYAWHGRHHVAQITALRERMKW